MTVLCPTTIDETLAALADHPDAHVLAGGTDLMVEINFRHRRPETVVALRNVAALRRWYIEPDGGAVWIGAGVTYSAMTAGPLATALPALAEAARTVGSPQIRNAGTLGGNLGTCSPAGDGLPVLSALDAAVDVASLDGHRTISIHDFMVGVKRNALQAGELIIGVRLPSVPGWQGYAKVGVRNSMVISTAGACLVHDSRESSVRIALGAVGPTIIRARSAEAWVNEQLAAPTRPAGMAAEFADRVAAESSPIDDHRSTAEYRRHAVAVLAKRLLERALA